MGYLHIVLLLGVHLCVAYAEVMSYCDLTKPESRENPAIVLDTPQNRARFAYPREAIAMALARNSAAREFVESQQIIANASRRDSSRNPTRSQAQTRNPGRKYDAPTMSTPMCESSETRVIGMFREDGAFCQVVQGQDVPYTVCSNAEGDMANPFPLYQKYFCSAESFVMRTAVMYCYGLDGASDTSIAPDMDLMSVDTPVQCTCRKYSCNLDGMMK